MDQGSTLPLTEMIKYIYIKRFLESSETPVLYRGRTVPKV